MLCFESCLAAGGVSPGRKSYGLSASALMFPAVCIFGVSHIGLKYFYTNMTEILNDKFTVKSQDSSSCGFLRNYLLTLC